MPIARLAEGVRETVDSPIDRAATRIADRLYNDPQLWSSKVKVAAVIAMGIRRYTVELEESYPLTALVIFGAGLASGLILGSVGAIMVLDWTI